MNKEKMWTAIFLCALGMVSLVTSCTAVNNYNTDVINSIAINNGYCQEQTLGQTTPSYLWKKCK